MEATKPMIDIKVDDNQAIVAYASIGGVFGEKVSEAILPKDFKQKFRKGYYLYQDGEIIENPDYEPPKEEIGTSKPSETETLKILLSQQATQMQAMAEEIQTLKEGK